MDSEECGTDLKLKLEHNSESVSGLVKTQIAWSCPQSWGLGRGGKSEFLTSQVMLMLLFRVHTAASYPGVVKRRYLEEHWIWGRSLLSWGF